MSDKKLQSKCKTCRRLGVCVFKFRCTGVLNRPNPPGQHGGSQRAKTSIYGMQLKETQKLRHYYGISTKQFRNYFKNASRSKQQTNEKLIQSLETRLDNMVYRMGFAGSLRSARQMVVHRHLLVNGKNVNKPGYVVKPEDKIELRKKSKEIQNYQDWFKFYYQEINYIERDEESLAAKLLRIPNRDEIPIQVEDQLVVEFMAR